MQYRVTKALLSVAVATFLMSLHSVSFSAILYQDNFAYADGNLVPQGGWSSHSGSGSLVQVSSQTISTNQGSGSRQDVNHSLSQTMASGDKWYAGFDVTVSALGDATTTYFAHFRDDGTGFNSRIFVTAPNVLNQDFTFGIGETSSSTPAATFGTNFDYLTTYRLVASYDFDTGVSELWVDPSSLLSPKILSTSQADPGEDIQQFAFRQSGGNTTQVIDNLVVATSFDEALANANVPEPVTLALMGLGLAGIGYQRRKQVKAA